MQRAEAVDLLRRLHQPQQAFYAGGDEAPVRVLLTDDIHWHVPGHDAIAGDYQGIEAVLAYFRRRRDLVDRTFRLHPGDVLVGDGARIAALTDGRSPYRRSCVPCSWVARSAGYDWNTCR
jgi:ketosteroid isomerase-like protein